MDVWKFWTVDVVGSVQLFQSVQIQLFEITLVLVPEALEWDCQVEFETNDSLRAGKDDFVWLVGHHFTS
jgi:hypothetical protein